MPKAIESKYDEIMTEFKLTPEQYEALIFKATSGWPVAIEVKPDGLKLTFISLEGAKEFCDRNEVVHVDGSPVEPYSTGNPFVVTDYIEWYVDVALPPKGESIHWIC